MISIHILKQIKFFSLRLMDARQKACCCCWCCSFCLHSFIFLTIFATLLLCVYCWYIMKSFSVMQWKEQNDIRISLYWHIVKNIIAGILCVWVKYNLLLYMRFNNSVAWFCLAEIFFKSDTQVYMYRFEI